MAAGISIRTLVTGEDTYVVVLAGSLDDGTVPAVRAALDRGVDSTVVVDLHDVTYVSPAGAALLDRPGIVVVAGGSALHLLEAAGSREPRSYPTLADALASVPGAL